MLKIIFSHIKSYLITGLITVVPIMLILLLFEWAIDLINNFFWLNLPDFLWSYYTPFYGLIFILIILISIGWFVSSFIGNLALSTIDKILSLFPVISNIYKGYRRLIDSFLSSNNKSNQKAVLVEFPRKNCWVVGFVTGETNKKVANIIKKDDIKYVNVFVPTTPNPTSGFLLVVNKKDIKELKISKTEALEFIITAGITNSKK